MLASDVQQTVFQDLVVELVPKDSMDIYPKDRGSIYNLTAFYNCGPRTRFNVLLSRFYDAPNYNIFESES